MTNLPSLSFETRKKDSTIFDYREHTVIGAWPQWLPIVSMDILKASTALFYHESTTSSGATAIVQSPLAFVRSGDPNVIHGQLRFLGNGSFYWSRTTISLTTSYSLNTYPTGVTPSTSDTRNLGFPLRCRTSFSSIRHYLGRGSGGGKRGYAY